MVTSIAEARVALEVASWRATIDQQPVEDLADVAVSAFAAGLDGQALRELAGAGQGDSRGLWDLWRAVIAEQGFETVDEQSALWNLVRHTATRIVEGSLDPVVGAQWLWRSASWRLEPEGDLRVFIGLASEIEDHPEQQDALAPLIVEECAVLLARPKPRRWLRLQASLDHVLSLSTPNGSLPRRFEDMGLSDPLRSDLGAWRRGWTETLDAGGFASTRDAEGFVAAGARIARALQDALGPEWNVEYYPEPIRPPGLRLQSDAR